MGINILNLKDGHYAKTPGAVAADISAGSRDEELQLDTVSSELQQFGNGYGYVLYGPEDAGGNRQMIAEFGAL